MASPLELDFYNLNQAAFSLLNICLHFATEMDEKPSTQILGNYPTELSCPGPQGGQIVDYPTELS